MYEKKVDAISGFLGLLGAMGSSSELPTRGDVIRDEWDGIVVDTCVGFDTGAWETGIMRDHHRDGSCEIAEQYENRGAAVIGHAKWVALLKADKDAKCPDICVWDIGGES